MQRSHFRVYFAKIIFFFPSQRITNFNSTFRSKRLNFFYWWIRIQSENYYENMTYQYEQIFIVKFKNRQQLFSFFSFNSKLRMYVLHNFTNISIYLTYWNKLKKEKCWEINRPSEKKKYFSFIIFFLAIIYKEFSFQECF